MGTMTGGGDFRYIEFAFDKAGTFMCVNFFSVLLL